MPESPDRTPEGWSRVAAEYDATVSPFLAQFAEDALHATALDAGERALDVAAGCGALAFLAARRGADVTAVDFAPGMVERLAAQAQAAKLDVDARVMDGQALDLPGGAFDAAYSNFGLIFFPDRVRGFREMHRVLAPGGRVGVTAWTDPERLDVFAVMMAAVKEVAPELPPPPVPPAVLSLADPVLFRHEMESAGFRDVRIDVVEHVWRVPSPEAAWDAVANTNPVFPTMIARVGPERAHALRDTVIRRFRERLAPDGHVPLRGIAHLGTGYV